MVMGEVFVEVPTKPPGDDTIRQLVIAFCEEGMVKEIDTTVGEVRVATKLVGGSGAVIIQHHRVDDRPKPIICADVDHSEYGRSGGGGPDESGRCPRRSGDCTAIAV